MHTRQFSSQETGWIFAHIQSSCEEGQQLICLKCRGTNGSHCRQLVPGSGKVHLKLQRVELTSVLPCCVCIRVPRIPITGNDAKRAAAWMGRQITEIMGNERLDAHYCGAASTSWTFMNHAKASPIVLYIQLGKTDREQKRCKNACSQFIRQPIAAPFVALWGRTRLSTVNPITVVTKIGQSVSKHTGCISAPA